MVRAMTSDPIPELHVSVMEAFNIYREIKRGGAPTRHPPHGSPEWEDWRIRTTCEQEEDEAQFCNAFKSGRLEALVNLKDGMRYRIRADEINTAWWPARILYSDEIQDFSDGPLAKFTGRTPFIPRADFIAWVEESTRDWLFDAIASGKLEPSNVENSLTAHGLKPLNPEPDPSIFDPLKEPFWTVAMAVAWISWGKAHAVTHQWDKFLQTGGWWRESRLFGQSKPGFIREQLSSRSLNWLSLYEVSSSTVTDQHSGQRMTVKEAREALWRRLQNGSIAATGIPEDGSARRAIAEHEWQDLDCYEIGDVEIFRHRPGLARDGYKSVTVTSATMLTLWPAHPQQEDDSNSTSKQAPLRPGPKSKIDRDGFEAEVHRWIAEYGIPDPRLDPDSRQADLERHMMSWHKDTIQERRNRDLVKKAMASYPH
jgi:hypothetical protein